MGLIEFAKKLWADGEAGGTPVTGEELNRLEDAIDGINEAALDKPTADATYAPLWQPSKAYTAGTPVLLPDGTSGTRTTTGTSRATFDATEKGLWTVSAGGVSSWGELQDKPAVIAAGTNAAAARTAIGAASAEPVGEDYTRALGVGSSTIDGLAAGLTTALDDYDIDFTTASTAKPGWQISHSAAAVGVRPLTVDGVVIPSSGSVVVIPMNMPESSNSTVSISWPGSLGGIVGTLASPGGSPTWTFTRAAAGDAVVFPRGTPFQPSTPDLFRGSVVLVNAGKNTLTTTRTGWDTRRVIDLTNHIADKFGGAGGRVLVIGQFCDTNTAEGSTTRTRINEVNAAQKAQYGDRFFDLGGYLTGTQVWADTGITPTTDDNTQQALGNKPPSLSADNGHMNAAAYAAVVSKLVNYINALGWLPSQAPGARTIEAVEDFHKPDGSIIGLTTTTGGKVWQHLPGGPTTAWLNVNSNRAGNPASSGARRGMIAVSGPNYRSSVRIALLGETAAGRGARLLARIQNYNTYYFIVPRRTTSAGGLSIWKSDAGVVSSLATSTTLPALTDQLGIEVVGSTIRCLIGDTVLIETTDASFATGPTGIELQTSETMFDNMVVESIAA